MSCELTKEEIKSILDYDQDTGVFSWKYRPNERPQWNARYSGKQAGCVRPDGYIAIRVNGKLYQAHRLAWLYIYGEFPDLEIDHINGERDDNKILNLRAVSSSVNQQNLRDARSHNKVGLLGVSYCSRRNKFYSRIRVSGVTTFLGLFGTAEEDHLSYVAAKRNIHDGCTI